MIPLSRLTPAPADRVVSSPNHGARGTSRIALIVLHATADGGNEQGAEAWLANPESDASCHLLIRRDGSITRMVPDSRRAWHAGRSEWPGVADVNDASLGWEIANRNDGREEYTDAQYRTVVHLLRHYLPQGLTRSDVVGHAMVAPGRKTDPRGWEWGRMWGLYDKAPEVVAPLVATDEPPNMEKIILPDYRHFQTAAQMRGKDPERMTLRDWAEVAEAVFRIAQRTGVKAAKYPADVLAGVLEETQ